MARIYDWLNDQQRNEKIFGSRLNDEFDGLHAQHPSSSTDNAIARYNGTIGTLQDSSATLGDDSLLTLNGTSALTNSVLTLLDIRHATSGSPAVGIGVGLQFTQETAADNHEAVAQITTVMSNVTGGDEHGDIRINLMDGGSLVERFKLSADGQFVLNAPFPNVQLRNDNANAAGEFIGQVDWYGRDDGGVIQEYAVIEAYIETATAGSEDANLRIHATTNGALREYMRIGHGEVITIANPGAPVTTQQADAESAPIFEILGNSAASSLMGIYRFGGNASPPVLTFSKSRHATVGSHTVVNSSDSLGQIMFCGSDGTNFETAAIILGWVNGSPGNNDMPGALSIYATPDASVTPREGLRVDGTTTATNTALMIYDVDNNTLERVTVGTANSGGAGFKLLRIPN